VSEKAREFASEVQEEAHALAEEGKDFWQKAKEFVGGKALDTPEHPSAEGPSSVPKDDSAV
jgi:hypothetical protein